MLLLYRYHQTIKSVVRSPQVTVPALLQHLLKLSNVRSTDAQHRGFDKYMKVPINLPTQLIEYRTVLSQFALELISKQFSRAQSMAESEEPHPTPCQCSFAKSYSLPCRHFFANCLSAGTDLFDVSLVDKRWAPAPVTASSTQSASITQSTSSTTVLDTRCGTSQQRFNSAMSRCTTIASILADLPVAEFQEAIKWLDAVELQVN